MTPQTFLAMFTPADQSGGRGLMVFLVQMALIIGIFYFLIIRPKVRQERTHRERLQQLKRGDEVVTVGGIVGEIVFMKDDRITLKSGESRVVVQRDRIADVRSSKSEEEKKAS